MSRGQWGLADIKVGKRNSQINRSQKILRGVAGIKSILVILRGVYGVMGPQRQTDLRQTDNTSSIGISIIAHCYYTTLPYYILLQLDMLGYTNMLLVPVQANIPSPSGPPISLSFLYNTKSRRLAERGTEGILLYVLILPISTCF